MCCIHSLSCNIPYQCMHIWLQSFLAEGLYLLTKLFIFYLFIQSFYFTLFFPSTKPSGFSETHAHKGGLGWGALGLVVGLAGQWGVLAPWGAIAISVPVHLASFCNLGISSLLWICTSWLVVTHDLLVWRIAQLTSKKFFCYYDDDDDDNENNNDYDTDGFCKGKKTGECPEKPSEQGQEPTTNSTHTGCLALESKPGCSCRRWTL